MRIGALEAGGTKMVLAIGDENGKIYEKTSIPTDTPDTTLPQIAQYFQTRNIEALGIACFGPIDPNRSSTTYGYITSTPKLAWRDCNIVGILGQVLGVPIGFDTDVNGSMLGEATWGIARDKASGIYITIGTGVGVGVMVDRKLVHGMLHPEGGHILMKPRDDDHYEGHCPYHKTCLEGMAAGPAIEERWGQKGYELADRDEVWDLEAYYIAQAIYGYICLLSPEIIILGGGVMHQKQLLPLIRKYVHEMNGGYINSRQMEDLDHYIVPSSLNDEQGILGAIKLGMEAKKYS